MYLTVSSLVSEQLTAEMITDKINKTVKKFNMLQKGDFVAVGVSGGADSMLLLNYLLSIKDELELRLLVMNVEHGIRGRSSVDDSAFVERYCNENGVPFECLKINAPKEAKACSMGVEEYSRKRRYEFFNSAGADKIATAHSLSDSVETALFRLSRGTSIKGMCSIPPVRDNVIRPLIECTSSEIRQACRNMGIPFVFDETNSDNAYSRNYIRNVVIPDFEKLNPSFEEAVERFIENCCEADAFLENEAERCLESCRDSSGVSVEKLKAYNPAVSKRAIALLAEESGFSLDSLHLGGVYELLNKTGKYQIKDDAFAVSNAKTLRFARLGDENEHSFTLKTKAVDYSDFLKNCELYKKEYQLFCDCDRIVGSVSARQRRAGDCLTPAKRGVTKTLKKLFNELSIPIENRNRIPVLVDEKGIIGVCGICCDERVRVGSDTKTVLLINSTED